MTVANNNSRNQYVATAGQTVFPYTFEIFTSSDVAVYLDSVALSQGTSYNVSNVGNDDGGNITLVTGATAGATITIYRDMPLDRLNDYQQSGDFLASEVNNDFDRLWLALGQQRSAINLAIRGSNLDPVLTATNTLLPPPAQRAGTYLGFDVDGKPSYLPLTPESVALTTLELIASTRLYDAGTVIATTGYSIDGDGGAASWAVTSTTGTISQSPAQLSGGLLNDAVGNQWAIKSNGIFNIACYGAIGDGSTACNLEFQAALSAASAASGGVVYIPAGRYRRANTLSGVTASIWTVTGDNITVQGVGDASIIYHDDRADEARSDLFSFTGDNLTLQNFKIEGTARQFTITNTSRYSQTLTGVGISKLRILNISIEAVHNMAMTMSQSEDIFVSGCRLVDIVRDGYRFTGGRNVRIIGNYGKNIADDCVAVHSLDASKYAMNVVVDGNVFEHCQGMKFLGAKNVTVTNNIMHRCIRAGVWIANNESSEGNTNMHSIKIVDNVFSDAFSSFGTNALIQILGRDVIADSSGKFPAFNTEALPYNYTNDIVDNSTPVMPIQRLEIRGNNFVRTLEAVSDYSDYGYGRFFDRVTTGFSIPTDSYFQDRVISNGDFNTYAVQLNAPCQTVQIEGNNFAGFRLSAIRIRHENFGLPLAYQYLTIKNNNFTNTGQSSGCIIALEDENPSKTNTSNIEIVENYFNGDPYYNTTQHNSNNTWVGDQSFIAIKQIPNTFLESVLVSKNTFRNVSATGITPSANTVPLEPNIIYADYTSSSASANNKGIRVPPEASGNIIVKIDGDPTSATFEQTVHFPRTTATAASFPLTGFWAYGHYISNRAPSPITDPDNGLYVVTGWVKGSTNSTGSVGTNGAGFLELRSFVQNIA